MRTLTTKIDEDLLKELKAVSEKSLIPQSTLIREGIKWMILRNKEDTLSPGFVQAAQKVLKQNRKLFKRLSRM